MSIYKCAAVSLSAILFLSPPAVAEPTRGAVATQPRATINARPAQKKSLPLTTFKAPALDLKLIPLATMDGWTPVTTAATRGGASLFSFEGQMSIATTGSDNTLYLAPFNPAKLTMISSLDWENLDDVAFTSQPECQASRRYTDKPADFEILCLGLGQAGNARLALIGKLGGTKKLLIDADLGGHDAGSAPVFVIPPSYSAGIPMSDSPYFKQNFDMTAAVWGGANGKLFVSRIAAGNYPAQVDYGTDWRLRETVRWASPPEPFTGAPGCSKTINQSVCAAATADGKVSVFTAQNYGDPVGFKWNATLSPALDVGLSGEVALEVTKAGRHFIVARGKDGKLYQTAWNGKGFSAWKSEGGYMIARTHPACVTINETAVCVVQGSDGRLYAKQLSSSAAL